MNDQQNTAIIIRTGRGLSIAGTRITIYDILDYVHADWPPKLIQDWLNLSEQQVTAALDYIAAHRADVEAEYQQVLAHAQEVRNAWERRNHNTLNTVAQLPPKQGFEDAIAKLRARKQELGLA
ncbi:MAG: DUF433 domain-containing protein [Herpetosiphon sp.]|nr:DUF433 domain-containing protein [Herpetosiphon sp.]